ncbi:MAG: N-acetyltransferase [Chloroflexota bacterium]
MIIRPLQSSPETVAALSDLIVETVAHGGSVSFMHPLSPGRAAEFWALALAAADRGTRVILGAFDGAQLVSTVTLDVDTPPNQPHRADIAKMMTRFTHRGRGIARALMIEAEALATMRDRWLLTLDTAADDGAGPFYEKLGFVKAGVIPQYALKPHGGFTDTIIYWKRLDAPAPTPPGADSLAMSDPR